MIERGVGNFLAGYCTGLEHFARQFEILGTFVSVIVCMTIRYYKILLNVDECDVY